MIIGIGNDLIDISRVERVLDRFGDRFVKRVYTSVERAKSERRANRVESYAKRFAAKEACSKALGTGIRMGVFWRDMAVTNLNSAHRQCTPRSCANKPNHRKNTADVNDLHLPLSHQRKRSHNSPYSSTRPVRPASRSACNRRRRRKSQNQRTGCMSPWRASP